MRTCKVGNNITVCLVVGLHFVVMYLVLLFNLNISKTFHELLSVLYALTKCTRLTILHFYRL